MRASLLRAACAVTLFAVAGCTTPITWPPVPQGPCSKDNGGCDQNAVCSVALTDAGSASTATCVCKPGFNGDGKTCACDDPDAVVVDGGCLNEACQMNNGGCDPNATCTNTASAPLCTCNSGFVGDGGWCGCAIPTDAIVDGRCLNLACEEDAGGCGPNSTCEDTATTPLCPCNEGYEEGDAGTGCVPVPVDAGMGDGGTDGGLGDGGLGDGGSGDAGVDAGH